jgi:hypothetical protein
MTTLLMAEFDRSDRLIEAASALCEDGFAVVDAFTPFPIPEIEVFIDRDPSPLRTVMLAAGLAVAGVAFSLQWYSAAVAYPLNSGGRPLNSWPVFLLVPFEVGVLAAAIAGLCVLLWHCDLPRLHHPVFDIVGFERATQDRFFLLVSDAVQDNRRSLRAALQSAGARVISEVRP